MPPWHICARAALKPAVLHSYGCTTQPNPTQPLPARRCVSYPVLMDSLHLRLHRMRDVLRRHMGQGEDVAVSEGAAFVVIQHWGWLLRIGNRSRYPLLLASPCQHIWPAASPAAAC